MPQTVTIKDVELEIQEGCSDIEVGPLWHLIEAIGNSDFSQQTQRLGEAYDALVAVLGPDVNQFWNLTVPGKPRPRLSMLELTELLTSVTNALLGPGQEPEPEQPAKSTASTAAKGFGDLVKERAQPQSDRIARLEQDLAELKAGQG